MLHKYHTMVFHRIHSHIYIQHRYIDGISVLKEAILLGLVKRARSPSISNSARYFNTCSLSVVILLINPAVASILKTSPNCLFTSNILSVSILLFVSVPKVYSLRFVLQIQIDFFQTIHPQDSSLVR